MFRLGAKLGMLRIGSKFMKQIKLNINSKTKKRHPRVVNCPTSNVAEEKMTVCFVVFMKDSKVYIIGGLDCDSQLPEYHHIPSSTVQVIDTPSFGKTASMSMGTAMYGGKSSALTAILDGKIYVFGSTGEPWTESRVGMPVVYEKQKKILVFYNGVNRGGSVIVDDRLYMFYLPKKELYAYDLVQGGQDFIPVHGLEKAVESINLHYRRAGYTRMFHLGNKVICMVWLVGTFFSYDVNCVEYYHIHCLKFHVNDRDGCLHAVVDRCDYYFLKSFVDVSDCFTM
ncbi:hypothetical protein IFM89_014568 [Coptis chinensis]|uniref:Uncharacterized protein n=1 Tax=Coptis chinensis TaxID=261450 RepID=A0A835GYX8_9MAGN|nr:hypothetical protein IFM89_014568 [Coptis chinensis]